MSLRSESEGSSMHRRNGWLRCLWEDAGPDRGYSWVILASTFVFSIGTYGVFSSGGAGVIFVEMLLVYGAKREEAMWPFSIMGIAQCISGLLSGFIVHFMDIRRMFLCASFLLTLGIVLCFWADSILWISISFGVIFGTGVGFSLNYCPFLLSQYFEKHKATANGIYLASIPISGFFLSPLLNYLIGIYGLRGTLLLLGGIVMQLIVASSLLRPRTPSHFPSLAPETPVQQQQQQKTRSPNEEKNNPLARTLLMYKDVLCEPLLYVITAHAAVGLNILVGVAITLVDFLIDCGYDRPQAIEALTIVAASGLVGRIVCGVVADRGWVTLRNLSVCSMIGQAIGLFALRLASTSFALMATALAIVCINEGFCHCLVNILYRHYIGHDKLPASMAVRLFAIGITSFVRPTIVGYFRDSLGTYVYFYYCLGACSALIGLMWIFEPWMVRRNKTEQQETFDQQDEMKPMTKVIESYDNSNIKNGKNLIL